MDVEIEHPHTHKGPSHHWIDRVATVAALFVSAISIFIAWHHGETMKELVHQNERLVEASSLPHLLLYSSNADPSGRPLLVFGAKNQGVGPAEIRTVELLIDGTPVDRPSKLLAACCGAIEVPGLITSTLLGTMIRPGETLEYLHLAFTPANQAIAAKLQAARAAGRIETRVCYCSVFDECWMRRSREQDRPHHVETCPIPKVQYTY